MLFYKRLQVILCFLGNKNFGEDLDDISDPDESEVAIDEDDLNNDCFEFGNIGFREEPLEITPEYNINYIITKVI